MSRFTLHEGDSREVLKTLAEASIDAIVCDPPYHLTTGKKGGSGAASEHKEGSPYAKVSRLNSAGFMGMQWDGGDVAMRPEVWAECLRVLKPGGYLLAFSGTRTQHRMVCAIEDAGFEIRDQIGWVYGSGFPKSLDVSKAIDKAAGAEREVIGQRTDGRFAYEFSEQAKKALGGVVAASSDTGFSGAMGQITAPATDAAKQWQGWGTALKPAWEPIVMARKPLIGTVAANVLAYGTGALNIEGCRIAIDPAADASQLRTMQRSQREPGDGWGMSTVAGDEPAVVRPDGRWPANIILSYPADEYQLRDDVTPTQLEELAGWLRANA